jgi:hypothetical protein
MSFLSWLKKRVRQKKPAKRGHSLVASEDPVSGPDALRIQQRLPPALSEPLMAVAGAAYLSKADYEERQLSLMKVLYAADPQMCSSQEWLAVFRHLFRNRCLRASGIARDKAVARAFADARQEGADLEELNAGFTAAIDQGDLDFAKKCLDRLLVIPRLHPGYRHLLEVCYRIHEGMPSGAQGLEKGRFFSNPKYLRRDFMEYIRGRSVAVVGPASSSHLNGEEIDSYDVVVRPNCAGPIPEEAKAHAGTRVAVSAYANGILKLAGADEDDSPVLKWVTDLDWVLFKKTTERMHPKIEATGKVVTGAVDSLVFHGAHNLMPFCVLTLLGYGPSRIKFFNSNFYFSQTVYSAGYLKNIFDEDRHKKLGNMEAKLPILLGSLAAHDCVTQVHLMRHLHRAGVVELDAESLSVVSLSTADYLAGLERIYIHPTLP